VISFRDGVVVNSFFTHHQALRDTALTDTTSLSPTVRKIMKGQDKDENDNKTLH
jgi:hypothetical protein